jgi:hypothetical protein
MEQIFEPNSQFKFDKLVLTNPIFVNSGNYFIKYLMNDAPLYIQPPKCVTKQGFIKGGKKLFCDLLFTNENESFIRWIEDLENYSQKYIFNNREKWFETDLEMHDIESSFTSPLKLYKSGKFYIVRTIIPTRLGKCTLRIFDEQEMDVPTESIQDGTAVMTIWEIQGIKCSTRNFQIDIEVKQMMVIPKSNLFDRCVISTSSRIENARDNVTLPPNSSGDLRSPSELVVGRLPALLPNSSDLRSDSVTDRVSSEEATKNVSSLLKSPSVVTPATPSSDKLAVDGYNEQKIPDITNSSGDRRSPEELGEGILLSDQENITTKIDESDDDDDDEYDYDNGFTIDIDEMESDDTVPLTTDNEPSSGVELVDFNPEDIQEPIDFQLKTRNDVYYEIYTNAKKKAEEARNLAISAFLEAKRIKDLYLIHESLDIFTGGHEHTNNK